ncbi:MAG TPA: serpin family protein [Xanthobacteraceae bacterium]|nr:serpin family protein [Xanthobacteraceae bacterium]
MMTPQVLTLAAHAADAAQARTVALADNALGRDLYVRLAATPGNIVFSPYSVGTAMAMVLSGARGETAAEMAAVLKQGLARDAIDSANTRLLAILNGYDKSSEPVACPPSMRFDGTDCAAALPADAQCRTGYRDGARCIAPAHRAATATLKAANALMLPKALGDLVSPQYAALLEASYRAQVFRGADLDAINRWVDRQTEGKIEKILDQIDPETPAVILNAVYFKAAWQAPFSREATNDSDFHLASRQTVKVSMMHRTGYYQMIARPGYRAIRLPYSVDALAMMVVVPDDVDGVDKVGRALDAEALTALFRDLTERKTVELALPRFKIGFRAELGKLFKQAGMRRAFDGSRADFSGMTGGSGGAVPFYIGEVVHRAVIDVTEEGTEAAAATAVAMMAASMPSRIEQLAVDRPFLFYITDEATGAILFQGRISDPRPQ